MKNKRPMSDKEAVGMVIRYLLGSSVQREVAERVGLHPTAMSQFKKGIRVPRGGNWDKLSKAFGHSVPILKGAMARVQHVAGSGGDEATQRRELERYFAVAGEERVVADIDRVEDPEYQGILNDLRALTSRLTSKIVADQTSRTR